MGGLFAPKINTPAVPQQSAIDNFINTRDEVNRTQSVKTQQPDGSWVVTHTRLPLTPEEQELENNLKRIADENLARYEELSSNFDVGQIPGLKEYVDSFVTTNKQMLGREAKVTRETAEKALARGGQADSTAAVQERSRINKGYMQGLAQIDRDAEGLKQDVRREQQDNALSLYSLATGRQDALLSRLTQSNQFNAQTSLSLANMGLQNQWNKYNAEMQNAQAKYQAKQQGLQNLMSLANLATMGYGGAKGWYKGA